MDRLHISLSSELSILNHYFVVTCLRVGHIHHKCSHLVPMTPFVLLIMQNCVVYVVHRTVIVVCMFLVILFKLTEGFVVES